MAAAIKYGEIVRLGTNGGRRKDMPNHKNLFDLVREEFPTAIMPTRTECLPKGSNQDGNQLAGAAAGISLNEVSPRNDQSRDAIIRMEMSDKDIVVTCTAVLDKDMYQVGRAETESVKICVDMPQPLPPGGNTISRYGARLIFTRKPDPRLIERGLDPHQARIYAAAFEKDRIFLGQNASTLALNNDQYDGFTTNGILILRPPKNLAKASIAEVEAWNPEWLEVSVGGKMFRVNGNLRTPPQTTNTMTEDTNYLADGTVIDLCGAQLLWRSNSSKIPLMSLAWLRQPLLSAQPGADQRQRSILCCASLNVVRSGLPASFDPQQDTLTEEELDSHPFVYIGCGHVVSRRDDDGSMQPQNECPIRGCGKRGPLTKLHCGLEPRFFIDSLPATHCFVPCGHMVPEKTALVWSKVKPPRDPPNAVCPFCETILDSQRPYIKLIITYDNEDEDEDEE